jgi:hypothetical protein
MPQPISGRDGGRIRPEMLTCRARGAAALLVLSFTRLLAHGGLRLPHRLTVAFFLVAVVSYLVCSAPGAPVRSGWTVLLVLCLVGTPAFWFDGRSFSGSMTLKGPKNLLLEGCVRMFYQKQVWRRHEPGEGAHRFRNRWSSTSLNVHRRVGAQSGVRLRPTLFVDGVFKTYHVDPVAQPQSCIDQPDVLGSCKPRRAFASFKSLVSKPSVNQA